MGRDRRRVIIGVPHHVVHRGNHQQPVFESDGDRALYLALVHRFSRQTGTAIAGFCLMSNHVHFVVVPSSVHSIASCFGRAHRKYSEFLNARRMTGGTNWEGRFFSEPMFGAHVLNGLRYVERNPVGAGLVRVASDWPWSSAAMHCGLGGSFDLLNIDVRGQDSDPLIWRALLGEELDESELMTVRWAVHRGEALPTDPRLVA